MRSFFALCLLGLMTGCSVSARDYAHTAPRFDLREFFNGPLEAEGIFQRRGGRVAERFRVAMTGTWKGDSGTLAEDFTYLDGTAPQQRTWYFERIDDHRIEGTASGTAGDVLGKAQGEVYGYALHWTYYVRQPVGDTYYNLHYDDWMYMLSPDLVINRSVVSKFGFEVGQVTLVIRKLGGDRRARASAKNPANPAR